MSTSTLTTVPFHGDSLCLISHNNEAYTPMKPIVDNMGLSWPAQQKKLNANKERWGIAIIAIPTQSGMQEALCMPVRKLPAFFGTISPNRVRKEIRERIILYQNECDDVLWKYWTGQQVGRKQKVLPGQEVLPATLDYEDSLKLHIARIYDLATKIHHEEQMIYRIVKEHRSDALKDTGPRHTVMTNMHTQLDKLFFILGYTLDAAKIHAKTLCAFGKMQ